MFDLEAEILRDAEKRIVKSFLDMIILMRLRKGSMSGYDVIDFIHKKFDFLISSGTVYSHLYFLERTNLIEGMLTKRKRVYELTEKGEETARAFLNLKQKIVGLMINVFIGE